MEPFFADLFGALDVICLASELAGGAGELGGVVGIFSANGEDELGGAAEFGERSLAVFGGVADGVVEDDFDLGALFTDFGDEGADAVDGLGGLGDDAEAFDLRNAGDVTGMQDDAGIWEISLEAADLDVAFFANDDGLAPIGDEFGKLGVGDFDEGAGGIGDLVSGLLPAFAVAI